MRNLFALLLCSLPAVLGAQATDFTPVTQRVERLVADARLPGASVLIVRDGDVLYERAPYALPLDLAIGDRLEIQATGAYTTTYSAVGFNGFEPLRSYYI